MNLVLTDTESNTGHDGDKKCAGYRDVYNISHLKSLHFC